MEIALDGPNTFAVDVVGVARYQHVLEAAGRGAVVDAVLVLTDTNPHDANAVEVHVGGALCGYLSRANAVSYRASLAEAGASAARVRCKAKVVGGFETADGGRAHFGLKLDLPPLQPR
jgi:hypothetical protein